MAIKGRILTDDDKKIMIDNYYNMSSSKIAKMLNLKESDVTNFWAKNNLRGKCKRQYPLNESCFDVIDNEAKAYTLGFIASDGCVYETKDKGKQNIVRISIHQCDEEILTDIKEKVFKTEKPIIYHKNTATLEISSNRIYESLIALDIKPRKTYGNSFVRLSDDLMRHFIRGYFDGDGSISNKLINKSLTSDINISISGYKKNMSKIVDYLAENNIIATFNEDRRRYNGDDVFGALTLPNKISKYAFLKYIYSDSFIGLKRKKDLAHAFCHAIECSTLPMDKITVIYYNNAVLK